MYNSKFAEYYDVFFEQDKYEKEAQFIGECVDEYGIGMNRLLDVGCGTGTHAIELSKSAQYVVGIDPSNDMINAAMAKPGAEEVIFIQGTVEETYTKQFDVVISMFNVVNHIESIPELKLMFTKIRKKMNLGGLFIFDCWNGIEIYRNGLAPKVTVKKVDGQVLSLYYSPTIDYMTGEATLDTTLSIDGNFLQRGVMKHILWTPKVIVDLVEMVGLELIRIVSNHSLKCDAKDRDFRLTFICRKVNVDD